MVQLERRRATGESLIEAIVQGGDGGEPAEALEYGRPVERPWPDDKARARPRIVACCSAALATKPGARLLQAMRAFAHRVCFDTMPWRPSSHALAKAIAPSTLNRIRQRRLAIQFVVADLSGQMSPQYCANQGNESPKLGLTAELLPLAGSSEGITRYQLYYVCVVNTQCCRNKHPMIIQCKVDILLRRVFD
jgi:hypothetical protein